MASPCTASDASSLAVKLARTQFTDSAFSAFRCGWRAQNRRLQDRKPANRAEHLAFLRRRLRTSGGAAFKPDRTPRKELALNTCKRHHGTFVVARDIGGGILLPLDFVLLY